MKSVLKKVWAVLLIASMTVTAGCGKRAEEPPKTESGLTGELEGNEKELAEITGSKLITPEKVAALSANTAAMWKLAGGKVSVGVKGVSGVSKDNVFGTEEEPDIEAAMYAEPDLVLVDNKAENYEDILSYLNMTEGAPPYIKAEIHSFDDYADCMFEMAKYTKDKDAYRYHVIDVREKNAEIIARGRDALEVLIRTMPLPESEIQDNSIAESPDAAKPDSSAAMPKAGDISGPTNAEGASNDSETALTDSSADSFPDDIDKVASERQSVTVMLLRVNKDSCTIQGSYDYVSNMLGDFGLVNVNPDTQPVTVTLHKETAGEEKAAVTDGAAEAGTTEDAETAFGTPENAETAAETPENAETASGTTEDAETASGTTENSETASGTPENAETTAETSENAKTESVNSEAVTAGTEEPVVTEAETEEEKAEAAFEKILKRNPDYIFVIYEGKEKEAAKTFKAVCESRDFWGEMTAVINRRVYSLPKSTFENPPNEQWDLAYEYLYQTMFVM